MAFLYSNSVKFDPPQIEICEIVMGKVLEFSYVCSCIDCVQFIFYVYSLVAIFEKYSSKIPVTTPGEPSVSVFI